MHFFYLLGHEDMDLRSRDFSRPLEDEDEDFRHPSQGRNRDQQYRPERRNNYNDRADIDLRHKDSDRFSGNADYDDRRDNYGDEDYRDFDRGRMERGNWGNREEPFDSPEKNHNLGMQYNDRGGDRGRGMDRGRGGDRGRGMDRGGFRHQDRDFDERQSGKSSGFRDQDYEPNRDQNYGDFRSEIENNYSGEPGRGRGYRDYNRDFEDRSRGPGQGHDPHTIADRDFGDYDNREERGRGYDDRGQGNRNMINESRDRLEPHGNDDWRGGEYDNWYPEGNNDSYEDDRSAGRGRKRPWEEMASRGGRRNDARGSFRGQRGGGGRGNSGRGWGRGDRGGRSRGGYRGRF